MKFLMQPVCGTTRCCQARYSLSDITSSASVVTGPANVPTWAAAYVLFTTLHALAHPHKLSLPPPLPLPPGVARSSLRSSYLLQFLAVVSHMDYTTRI